MTQTIHEILGINRPEGEWPHRCSKCTIDIPEYVVPLVLCSRETGNQLWVYCPECKKKIWPLVIATGGRFDG